MQFLFRLKDSENVSQGMEDEHKESKSLDLGHDKIRQNPDRQNPARALLD